MSTSTPKVFRWDDPSAPQLTGQNGALLSILSACLVGTSGVAYGSGASQKASAGWSAPFTNTATKGVFRNSTSAGGTGCYVRILDDGSLAATAKEATMIAYDAMTDIDTGTGATPGTTGFYVRKSETDSSTVHPWILIADECTFYFWIDSNLATPTAASNAQAIYGAGDYISFASSDTTRYFCAGKDLPNTAASSAHSAFIFGTCAASDANPWHGNSIATDQTLAGSPVAAAVYVPNNIAANNMLSRSSLADPTPGFGGRIYLPCNFVCTSGGGVPRGRYRGAYFSLNSSAPSLTAGTSYSAQDGGFSAALIGMPGYTSSNGATGAIFVDAANAWDQ